ncbi:MAG: hypothetical protein K2J79_09265, partial [Ruminiclostridium sp.]|nr:hypothetical protein [Ruminiclostridium sp.]
LYSIQNSTQTIITFFQINVKNGVTKIKRNSKGFYIAFGAIDALLVLVTLVLLFFSIAYRGNLAPKLFSHRVYIMDTEAFSLVKKGSAVIADRVNFDQILPGNIVIFTDESEKTSVGEVQKANFENNVYTYSVKNDAGNILTVGQSHILGKGMYYSEILGGVVSFATSPWGVLCIAILPCTAFVIWEVVAAVKRKAPQPTVDTIKKQYETPTYIPPQKKNDEEIPLEDRIAFAEDRQRLVEAAGLYAPSPKKPEPTKQPAPQPRPTVNAKEIDRLIQQAKSKNSKDPGYDSGEAKRSSPQPTAPTRKPSATPVGVARSAYQQVQKSFEAAEEKPSRPAPMPLDIDDKPLKRIDSEYTAPARPEPKHSHARSSPRLSRLDSLLQEESTNDSMYDINTILGNIGKK